MGERTRDKRGALARQCERRLRVTDARAGRRYLGGRNQGPLALLQTGDFQFALLHLPARFVGFLLRGRVLRHQALQAGEESFPPAPDRTARAPGCFRCR